MDLRIVATEAPPAAAPQPPGRRPARSARPGRAAAPEAVDRPAAPRCRRRTGSPARPEVTTVGGIRVSVTLRRLDLPLGLERVERLLNEGYREEIGDADAHLDSADVSREPLIAPSLLSADFARLADEAQRVADADWLHFDVMDAHFVPNLTFGLPVMQAVQAVSPVPLDCHLMIENPERWAPGYAEAGARNVTVHAEACTDPRAVARDIRAAGALAGLALKPGTPLEDYLDVLPDFDTLLVMTVEPGFGGQSFIADVLPKVTPGPRAGRHRPPDAVRRGRRRHQRRHDRAGRRGRRRRVRRRLRRLRRRRPVEGDRRAAGAGRRGDARVSVSDGRAAPAMARARELGESVLGTTSPNPAVGAVILDADGTPVGEGATAPPGGPHAEVTALAQAGDRARGGTAVVTLEPCAHTGRTGPCADALLAAGVARVVVAVPEPTELAGGGADRLRAAGRGRRARASSRPRPRPARWRPG